MVQMVIVGYGITVVWRRTVESAGILGRGQNQRQKFVNQRPKATKMVKLPKERV